MPVEHPYLSLTAVAWQIWIGLAKSVEASSFQNSWIIEGHVLVWDRSWGDVKPPRHTSDTLCCWNRDYSEPAPFLLLKGTRFVVKLADDILSRLDAAAAALASTTPAVAHLVKSASRNIIFEERHYPDGATAEDLVMVRENFRLSSAGVATRRALLTYPPSPERSYYLGYTMHFIRAVTTDTDELEVSFAITKPRIASALFPDYKFPVSA